MQVPCSLRSSANVLSRKAASQVSRENGIPPRWLGRRADKERLSEAANESGQRQRPAKAANENGQ
ncbi:hypothetical protein BWU74_14930 [Paraburkholderia caledonica]|nr:hypothetical protein BWU74_14930 [Burkholderia sp. Bk]